MFNYGPRTRRGKVILRCEARVIYYVKQPIPTYGMWCHIFNDSKVYINK
jgi:hypothetical protein